MLRYLFANLIDEEIRRDEAFRQKLNEGATKRIAAGRVAPPLAIAIPSNPGWAPGDASSATPRAVSQYPPATPGLAIGLATPGSPAPPVGPEGFAALSPLEKRASYISRPSMEREDYFSDAIQSPDGGPKPAPAPGTEAAAPAADQPAKQAETPTPNPKDAKDGSKEKDKDTTKSSTAFKKLRMGMSFSTKKLGRSLSATTAEKPAVLDEKAEESESSSNHEKEFDDSFLGVLQKLHAEYEKLASESPDTPVDSRLTPSLANDTPVLKLPPATQVIIQEETSGGSAEIYRGTVASVGCATDADAIEARAPRWLGEALLLNALPLKEPVKISFVLHPWGGLLPPIVSADGNNRLNANRMLRVKKILAYVAERIDPVPEGAEVEEGALKPEEYLELYCNEQVSLPYPYPPALAAPSYPTPHPPFCPSTNPNLVATKQNVPSNPPHPGLARRQRRGAALQGQRQEGDSHAACCYCCCCWSRCGGGVQGGGCGRWGGAAGEGGREAVGYGGLVCSA